ncbi:MAG: XdhC family protein [Chloroflexota bacterium]
MREILERVEEWRTRGERVVVATVLATAGSTPRPGGAKMAVTARGDVAGSISGGCVDTDVMEHALEVLRTGQPQVLEYGYSPDMTWEVGLMCGGSIQVFVEPLEESMVGPVDDAWMTDLSLQSGDRACAV